MRRSEQQEVLSSLLAARGSALLSTATLLAGSRQGGEDLLQSSLERLLRRWSALHDDVEGYLRRTMYHLAVDGWRAARRRPEMLGGAELTVVVNDGSDRVLVRRVLLDALVELPARQRAVLVMRYFEQMTESEVAAGLGCSVGTVKSSASRGLDRLRATHPELASEEELA
jgi:RNA polymerase sigma-70 factor (sigma-E family)